MSGARIPDYSIYQALRTLVRQKQLTSERHGRQLIFTPAGGRSTRSGSTSSEVGEPAAATPAASNASRRPVLHTIAPGEVTIVHIGEGHIETATNVHGRLVLERHRRPSA